MEQSGKIRRSSSPIGAPILFVLNPHGTLQLCVYYQGLNKITIRNKYRLPLMQELRSSLGKATVLTKLDLKNGYYLIRKVEAGEWKTAFKSRYGLYEYMVIPFGLFNAPSAFQGMTNNVFCDMLNVGVMTYMDDILIYSETIEEHIPMVRKVMDRLRKAGLCVSIKKSTFHVREVEFLGYKISDNGISMTTKKVEDITAGLSPQKVVNV